MQFFTGISRNTQSKSYLSVSGISKIVHCGIRIVMPYWNFTYNNYYFCCKKAKSSDKTLRQQSSMKKVMKWFWNEKSPGREPSNMAAESSSQFENFCMTLWALWPSFHSDPHVGRLQVNQGKVLLQMASPLIKATGSLKLYFYLYISIKE